MIRVRVQAAVRATETKKIPLSFDYCIAAQLKTSTSAKVDSKLEAEITVAADVI
jgi:hypothetical protein